jgi:hypothetical protein
LVLKYNQIVFSKRKAAEKIARGVNSRRKGGAAPAAQEEDEDEGEF